MRTEKCFCLTDYARQLLLLGPKGTALVLGAVTAYVSLQAMQGRAAVASRDACRLLCPRRACYGVLRFIMESGAKGCEVIVSGKLRAQRAKAMKFKDGFMIASGNPVNDYIDCAVRHVMLRQGVLGIKVGWETASSLPEHAAVVRSTHTDRARTVGACQRRWRMSHCVFRGWRGYLRPCLGITGADHEGMGPQRQAGPAAANARPGDGAAAQGGGAHL